MEGLIRHVLHPIGCPLPDKLLNVLLTETVTGDNLCVLRANDHYRFGPRWAVHLLREINQHAFGLGAVQVRRAHATIRADSRHRTRAGSEAALDMKRLPRACFFVLCDTETVFAGPAEGRFARSTGIRAADIALNQANASAMVALARHPSPSAFEPPLILICFRIGPLTINIIAGP